MRHVLNAAGLASLPEKVVGPRYDRSKLSPGIVHIGVGNFHRAHMGVYLDDLFALGKSHDWAICGAGVRPGDARMRDALARQDWLTTVVELDPSGLQARIIGSMVDFALVEPSETIRRMADPKTRIVSLTITEGGYFVDSLTDSFDTSAVEIVDDAAHPDQPKTVFGMILAALLQRRERELPPFTIMSCDNLPGNGHVTRNATVGLARLSDPAFAEWVAANVAFPNGMVDCITPATSDRERALIADQFGVVDAAPVVCEPFRQWVLEDAFPQGRPALEEVGVEFVEDVAPYELMKLRILNGGHAAIAYASALLGYHFVHDAMADPLIRDWLGTLAVREVIPTLHPISGVSFEAYLAKITSRFSNPEIGDTIPRLCLDGSNRQPKFILPTLRDALKDSRPIDGLTLEVALWCRYCAGVDEAGRDIPANDSNYADLRARAVTAKTDPLAFISNRSVFGTLGENERFASSFARTLTDVWHRGCRPVITDYLIDN